MSLEWMSGYKDATTRVEGGLEGMRALLISRRIRMHLFSLLCTLCFISVPSSRPFLQLPSPVSTVCEL